MKIKKAIKFLKKDELQNLYQQIGQEKGLEAVLKDFYQRLSKDVLVGFFFENKDVEAIAMKQKQFLMRAMGAAPSYLGKPPAQAHTELPPILTGHFDRRLRILEETLKDHGLNEGQVQLWIEFESAFREAIIESKKIL